MLIYHRSTTCVSRCWIRSVCCFHSSAYFSYHFLIIPESFVVSLKMSVQSCNCRSELQGLTGSSWCPSLITGIAACPQTKHLSHKKQIRWRLCRAGSRCERVRVLLRKRSSVCREIWRWQPVCLQHSTVSKAHSISGHYEYYLGTWVSLSYDNAVLCKYHFHNSLVVSKYARTRDTWLTFGCTDEICCWRVRLWNDFLLHMQQIHRCGVSLNDLF